MNEIIFLVATILCLAMVVVLYKLFGKSGLYVWAAISAVLVNLIVPKCITLFGLAASAGNILYASSFLATDILSENHSHKDARKCVLIGGIGTLSYLAVSQITLLFTPNEFDFISQSMKDVFQLAPRMTLTSIFCYLISNTLDTYLYQFISIKTDKLWIRNNLSTMTSQFVDSVLFSVIAFVGVMPLRGIIEFAATTYVIKLIVTAIDTPFIYLSKKIKHKEQ